MGERAVPSADLNISFGNNDVDGGSNNEEQKSSSMKDPNQAANHVSQLGESRNFLKSKSKLIRKMNSMDVDKEMSMKMERVVQAYEAKIKELEQLKNTHKILTFMIVHDLKHPTETLIHLVSNKKKELKQSIR